MNAYVELQARLPDEERLSTERHCEPEEAAA